MSDQSITALAQALCDSSSHMNLMPRTEQRPCQYHRDRAKATLAVLEEAGWTLGWMMTAHVLKDYVRDPAAEQSRLDAENLRRRVPPITS